MIVNDLLITCKSVSGEVAVVDKVLLAEWPRETNGSFPIQKDSEVPPYCQKMILLLPLDPIASLCMLKVKEVPILSDPPKVIQVSSFS